VEQSVYGALFGCRTEHRVLSTVAEFRATLENDWLFLTWYTKLTIKMPSKQTSIFVVFKIPKAIRRTFY
jgi:hypothetical protein